MTPEYVKQLEDANSCLMNMIDSSRGVNWIDITGSDKSITRSNLILFGTVAIAYVVLVDNVWERYYLKYTISSGKSGYIFDQYKNNEYKSFEEDMMEPINYAKSSVRRRAMASLGNSMRFMYGG